MKNPHGVPPTRYMKRKGSRYAITCGLNCGPIFRGEVYGSSDIKIDDHCNEEISCLIGNDGNNGYECDPKYKKSLFVNSDGPDLDNDFSVFDYEVFTH